MTRHRLRMVALLAVVASTAILAGTAAADNHTIDEKAPLYENTSEVSTDRWMFGIDTSLGGLVTLASRTGTYVIGGGGGGLSGALLTGVVTMGLAVGTVARAGVGSVAGATLAVAGTFAAVGAGIAPTWMTAVVMFGVGIVLAGVAKRVVG